jgi:hypothetical protein
MASDFSPSLPPSSAYHNATATQKLNDGIAAIRRAKSLQRRNPVDPGNIRPLLWGCGIPLMSCLVATACLGIPWALLWVAMLGIMMYVGERKRERSARRWEQELQSAKKQAETASLYLRSIKDPSAMCYLLSARDTEFDDPSAQVPPELYPVIVRLLPKIDPHTYMHLTESQRITLRSFIDIHHSLSNPDFVIEVLRLVERAKDTRSMARVWRLIDHPAITTEGCRVKEAALALLPVLEEAARKQKVGEQLLRPSSEPEGILLRPAGHSGEMQDVLLRPGSED